MFEKHFLLIIKYPNKTDFDILKQIEKVKGVEFAHFTLPEASFEIICEARWKEKDVWKRVQEIKYLSDHLDIDIRQLVKA